GHGPHHGLGIARRIAHATYRSAHEFDTRFGHQSQGEGATLVAGATHERGRFAVESYLDHHADKISRRFDANSYIVLTESLLTQDVGRGRGGVRAALGQVTAKPLVVGVDTDRLYSIAKQERIASAIHGPAAMEVMPSPYRHDGLLMEIDQTGGLIRGSPHDVDCSRPAVAPGCTRRQLCAGATATGARRRGRVRGHAGAVSNAP